MHAMKVEHTYKQNVAHVFCFCEWAFETLFVSGINSFAIVFITLYSISIT